MQQKITIRRRFFADFKMNASASTSLPPKACATLMSLPGELLAVIDSFLPCEDSHNFKMTAERISLALRNNFQLFDKMNLSDDPAECRMIDSRGRAPSRPFCAQNAARIISIMPNLEEITVIMKDVSINRNPHLPVYSLADCTPYTPGGYLLHLLGSIPPAQLSLRQLSLHVDVMIETLNDAVIFCPYEDLKFALDHLTNANFNTFVQISVCCAQFKASDENARNLLIAGMQHILKHTDAMGAKTDFVAEPCEGYVDMTVEKGAVEYSFAFFYYNPTICEPSVDEDLPFMFPLE
ncbi:unnamed protein product [Caenorhabditis auriculariae]|uniref:Uncharacterized protein n=1 Tax=Caenorhabditis auriculariae TaxID=2777116 RepID=A0A8S1HEL1_9PELO|nr:unnamed protein product [Caenorhabditis auriculariae]